MQSYNPSMTPNPRDWLSMDEAERVELISQYHEEKGEYGESLAAHAAIHCAVETQIAMKTSEVCNALGRLLDQGLHRHDAIHAIGSILAEHMNDLLSGKEEDTDDPNEKYYDRLSRFNASDWQSDA